MRRCRGVKQIETVRDAFSAGGQQEGDDDCMKRQRVYG